MSWVDLRLKAQKRLRIDNACGHTYYAGALSDKSHVIDLGANIGLFSESLMRRFGCHCYAVEASPDLCEAIHANALIRKFNYAINDNDLPVYFTRADAGGEAGNIMDREVTPRISLQPKICIQGRKLESFLKELGVPVIDLIKIDIEGAEIAALDAATDDTLRKIKQITVEFHDFIPELKISSGVHRIIRRLESLGFFYFNFAPPYHRDCLFLNTGVLKIPVHTSLFLRSLGFYFRLHYGKNT